MKKLYTLLNSFLIFSFAASAQSFDWINHNTVNYNLNPELPRQTSCISTSGKIYSGRMITQTQLFGNTIYSTGSIDCYNTTGQLQWSFSLGQKAVIDKMTADANGNVYIGGSYMETLNLNGTDSLLNTGSGFNVNVFLLSLDPTGNIRWKRNLSLGSNATRVEAMAIDMQNNFWYGIMNVFDINIFRTDNINGQDMQVIFLNNARTLGGFCFDPNNDLFVSGSTEMGNMIIGMMTVNVPETYMMFVAHILNNGTGNWVELAHDVTFQSPVVVSDGTGGAYVAGSLMDSTNFGTVSFHGPQWVYDIFVTRVSSSGNFSWGVEVPIVPAITGDFQPGTNDFLTADAGHVYISGICRGVVDWGNGVITGSAPIPGPSREFAVICFDQNGTPLWNLDGGKSDFDMAYSLHAMPSGDCYYSGAVIDTASFGSTIINQNGGLAYVVGKITTAPTTVTDMEPENNFSVFPVPADKKLFITGTIPNIRLLPRITPFVSLYNVNGSEILKKELPVNRENLNMHLDVSSLPPGIYFVKFTGIMETKNFKVSIVHQ